jgi:hypothetical protein
MVWVFEDGPPRHRLPERRLPSLARHSAYKRTHACDPHSGMCMAIMISKRARGSTLKDQAQITVLLPHQSSLLPKPNETSLAPSGLHHNAVAVARPADH